MQQPSNQTKQADLLSRPASPGKTDTSQEAAEAITNLRGKRLEVYDCIVESRDGIIPSDVSFITGMSILTVRPRVTELHKLGLIVDTGRRGKNENDRNEIVWKVKP